MCSLNFVLDTDWWVNTKFQSTVGSGATAPSVETITALYILHLVYHIVYIHSLGSAAGGFFQAADTEQMQNQYDNASPSFYDAYYAPHVQPQGGNYNQQQQPPQHSDRSFHSSAPAQSSGVAEHMLTRPKMKSPPKHCDAELNSWPKRSRTANSSLRISQRTTTTITTRTQGHRDGNLLSAAKMFTQQSFIDER